MACSGCSRKMLGPNDKIEVKEGFDESYRNIKKLRRNRILFFTLLIFLSLFLIYIMLKEI